MTLHSTLEPGLAHETTERVDVVACVDARARRSAVARPTRPGRYLEVEGLSETLMLPLSRGITHIGRGLTADLHLDEASVSRRHAILINRRNALLIDDRSANGTLVNGHRVERAELRDGDVLTLGRVVVRYVEI